MLDDKLIKVFEAENVAANAEAEVLKSLLDSAGIPAVIRQKMPTFRRNGGVLLLVLESDREDAEALIRDAQSGAALADQES